MEDENQNAPALAAMPVVAQEAAAQTDSRSEALNRFSDLLYDVKDLMKEQQYIDLCAAAQNLSNAALSSQCTIGAARGVWRGLVIASIS